MCVVHIYVYIYAPLLPSDTSGKQNPLKKCPLYGSKEKSALYIYNDKNNPSPERRDACGRVCPCVGFPPHSPPSLPPSPPPPRVCYLSGLRSTMPITKIFFPGLIPPLMCPQKGTIWKGQGEGRGGDQGHSASAAAALAQPGVRGLKKPTKNKQTQTTNKPPSPHPPKKRPK